MKFLKKRRWLLIWVINQAWLRKPRRPTQQRHIYEPDFNPYRYSFSELAWFQNDIFWAIVAWSPACWILSLLGSHSAQMLVPLFHHRYPKDLYLVVMEEERTSCFKKKRCWLVYRWWSCQVSISTPFVLTEILWFFVVPLRTSRKTTKQQYGLYISLPVYYSIFTQTFWDIDSISK